MTASCNAAKPPPPSKPTSRGEKCGSDANNGGGAEQSGGDTESATLPCSGGAEPSTSTMRRPGRRAARVLW